MKLGKRKKENFENVSDHKVKMWRMYKGIEWSIGKRKREIFENVSDQKMKMWKMYKEN